MPKAAIKLNAPLETLPLGEIAAKLIEKTNSRTQQKTKV
jgi:chemotaxis response regulator CheB